MYVMLAAVGIAVRVTDIYAVFPAFLAAVFNFELALWKTGICGTAFCVIWMLREKILVNFS